MSDQSGWPIGAHMRFKLDAEMQEKHRWLRGSLALVVGPLACVKPGDGLRRWSLRQSVYSYPMGRTGDALPVQLEPLPHAHGSSAGELAEFDLTASLPAPAAPERTYEELSREEQKAVDHADGLHQARMMAVTDRAMAEARRQKQARLADSDTPSGESLTSSPGVLEILKGPRPARWDWLSPYGRALNDKTKGAEVHDE